MDVTNRNEAIQKRAEMEAKTTYSEIPPKSHAAQLFTSSINNYKSETGSSFSDGNRIGFTNNLRTPLDVQAGVKSSGQQQIRAFSQQQEVFGQPQVKAPGQEEFGQQQARAFGQQQEQQAFVQPQIRAFGQQQEVFNQQQLTPSYRPEFGYTSFQQQGLSQNIQPRQSQSHGPCATQCQQNSCYMQRCNRGLDPVFGIPTFAPPLFPLTLPTLPTFSLPTVTPPTFQPFISYPTVAPPSSHSPLQPVPGYIDSSGSRNTISQNSPSFLPLSSIKENFDPNDRLMQLSVAPIAQAATASVSNAIPVQSSEVLSGRPILLSANPASSLQATLKPLSTFEEFIARLGYRNVSLAPLTPAALVIPSEISLPNTYSSLSPLSQTTTTTVASPENQARLLVPGFDFQTSQRNPYQPAVLYIPQQWPLTTSENGTLQRSRENQSERYENIGKNTDEETEIESFVGIHDYDVERIRQQFTHRVFCFTNHIDHIFITLSLVANLSNILRFPIICSENGGSQYSSLPSIRLFHHLCPAFGGIGVAMLFVAIFKNILLSYSAMGIFYTFKSVTVLFSSLSRTTWLECVYESHSSCYDPYLKCNEAIGSYQYYSKCYNLQLLSNKTNLYYTWEQIVIAMTSTSEALREFPPNIYWKEKINKPRKISEFLVASATIEQAIIAIIAILGIRLYARVPSIFLHSSIYCDITAGLHGNLYYLCNCKVGFQNTFALIAEGFSPDMHKFLHLKTWITAALQAFSDITVRYFYFALLLPILALLELLISIHIYSLKRLMVNLHTMLGGPPNIFGISWYWTACWYIITPILCMISLPFALFIIIKGEVYSDTVALIFLTMLPLSIIIISMIIHIARIYKTGRTIKSLFVADLCWTPELGIYRQQALYEERATRSSYLPPKNAPKPRSLLPPNAPKPPPPPNIPKRLPRLVPPNIPKPLPPNGPNGRGLKPYGPSGPKRLPNLNGPKRVPTTPNDPYCPKGPNRYPKGS
ncbi:Transporter [Dirofilaria immitis]|nr:Transporter [Dirofilaria immitis]